MIKNNTPYLGKIRLKFEKYPHYSSGSNKLNKVHLNLGFTKLVSRIYPNRTENGWQIDPVKVSLIEKYTEGFIREHKFGPNLEYTLQNCFVTADGFAVGDIEQAWWYFNNGMTVCEEYPRGVAKVWRTAKSDKTVVSGTDGLEGYYGYSHRGGQLFKIGDRVFDPSYEPIRKDYSYQDWDMLNAKLHEANALRQKAGETETATLRDVTPFRLRGKQTIHTLDQALEAAIEISKYLS